MELRRPLLFEIRIRNSNWHKAYILTLRIPLQNKRLNNLDSIRANTNQGMVPNAECCRRQPKQSSYNSDPSGFLVATVRRGDLGIFAPPPSEQTNQRDRRRPTISCLPFCPTRPRPQSFCLHSPYLFQELDRCSSDDEVPKTNAAVSSANQTIEWGPPSDP